MTSRLEATYAVGGWNMRLLKYSVDSSLDGFIARENHAYDFLATVGEHMDEFHASIRLFDVALMGRKTYEIGLEAGIIKVSSGLEQYVVSNTLAATIDPRIKILSKNAARAVRALKDGDGKAILLSGGAQLAARLLHERLIDELIVRTHPVIIGSGIPLFTGISNDVNLMPYDHKVYGNGVALNSYYLKYD